MALNWGDIQFWLSQPLRELGRWIEANNSVIAERERRARSGGRK